MQTMSKTEFNALAQESLLFAQIKAEAVGVTRAQVDLWTGSFKREWRRDVMTGLILPLHHNQVTNPARQQVTKAKQTEAGRVHTKTERALLLPRILQKQAF